MTDAELQAIEARAKDADGFCECCGHEVGGMREHEQECPVGLLIAEVRALRAKLDLYAQPRDQAKPVEQWESFTSRALAQLTAVEKERDALRAVVEAVQRGTEMLCPSCFNSVTDTEDRIDRGHAPDCALAKVLGK